MKLTPTQKADKDLISTHKAPKPCQSPKYLDEVFWVDLDVPFCGKVVSYSCFSDKYEIIHEDSSYRRQSDRIFSSMHDAIDFAIHGHLQSMHDVLQAIEDNDIKGDIMIQEHLEAVERHKRAIRFLESMEAYNGKTFKK